MNQPTFSQRLISLDVLRGLTVAGMILVNNGYGESFEMLQHSRWNGMTPCDLVFPFFLFIMGVSMYVSMSRRGFQPTPSTLRKVLKRTVLLFAIGLAIHWVDMAVWGNPWDFAHLRIWAVLQRIALCYLLASLFALCCNHKYLLHTIVGLLALYTIILLVGHGYAEDASVNVLAQVDLSLFGPDHLYTKSPVDPEGLVGTISGVAHVLLGFYCGRQLVEKPAMQQKVIALFVVGTICLVGGYLLSYGLPLNKRIWSPSYVLVTCGLCSLLLALFTYVIDVRSRMPRFFRSMQVFGMNALALYVCSELLAILFGRFGISSVLYDLLHSAIPWDKWASLAYALTFVAINYAIGYVLWRRKVFIKL